MQLDYLLQCGMTKTDAAVQTLSDINPDVVLEVDASFFSQRVF